MAPGGPTAGSPPAGAGIHDGLVTPLSASLYSGMEVLPLVGFQDHLLRRFARAEMVRLREGAEFAVLREVADEVWVLAEGSAEFQLEDRRPGSPTRGSRQIHRLGEPTRLLVPFGVHVRILSRSNATLLLRFMTHHEIEDRPLPEG